MKTVYINARIFRGGRFVEQPLAVEEGRIAADTTPRDGDRIVDLRG